MHQNVTPRELAGYIAEIRRKITIIINVMHWKHETPVQQLDIYF